MSRRIKRTTSPGDRAKAARSKRDFGRDERVKTERPASHRPRPKPAHFTEKRSEHRQEKPSHVDEKPVKVEVPLPTKVQTVVVTPDEDNMRVDRFLEARFPGLSFSHIQRVVRKGELRVDGKRADSKDRLQAGQNIRIPPLRLDTPKVSGKLSEAEAKTLQQ